MIVFSGVLWYPDYIVILYFAILCEPRSGNRHRTRRSGLGSPAAFGEKQRRFPLMKKKLVFLAVTLCVLIALCPLPTEAAAGDVAINTTNFPDSKF